MLLADRFVGNVGDDADLAERLDRSEALAVTVSETERRRSRVRTTAEDGTDLGVVIGRELREGDVLAADDTLVRVSLEPVGALVVDLGGIDIDASAVRAALELGHHVGNRHWNLALDGEWAYFPVTDSRERMKAEVESVLPDGAVLDYDEVSPALFDEGDTAEAHSRGPDHDDYHSHPHGEGHSHGRDGHAHDIREPDSEGSP